MLLNYYLFHLLEHKYERYNLKMLIVYYYRGNHKNLSLPVVVRAAGDTTFDNRGTSSQQSTV